MQLTCYQITAEASLQVLEGDFPLQQWKEGSGVYCITIHSWQEEELRGFLEPFGVTPLMADFFVLKSKISAVLPLEDEICFQFPSHYSDTDNNSFDHYIGCLCLKNLIMVINTGPAKEQSSFVDVLKSRFVLEEASTSGLLGVFLARESIRSVHYIDDLRELIFELDERMDRDPDSVDADEIRQAKRSQQRYETMADGQMLCFKQLSTLGSDILDFSNASTHFQLAVTNAESASQSVDRLGRSLTDLSYRYDSNQQEKTNHRLAVLTILSAIFMPPTLMAGIYGMNFSNMPELGLEWGYPLTLFAMAVIAIVMYVYFKKGGWLD